MLAGRSSAIEEAPLTAAETFSLNLTKFLECAKTCNFSFLPSVLWMDDDDHHAAQQFEPNYGVERNYEPTDLSLFRLQLPMSAHEDRARHARTIPVERPTHYCCKLLPGHPEPLQRQRRRTMEPQNSDQLEELL